VQGALPEERFRQLDRGLRAAGRRMGPVRDAAVALGLMQTLEADGALRARVVAPLREFLEAEHAQAWDALRADDGPERVRTDLDGLRLAHADVADLDVLTLHGGLARTYQRGHSRRAEAAQKPDAEALHAWRRQAKHLGYQLRLLVQAWPLVLRPTVRTVDALTDALGDDHDLAELVRCAKGANLRNVDLKGLKGVAQTRREALQATAWPLGARLYAEDARFFARRMTVYLATALAEQHHVLIRPLNGLAVPFPPNRPIASSLSPA